MLKFRTINIVFGVFLVFLLIYDHFQGVPFWFFLILTVTYLGLHVYGTMVLSTQFFLPVKFRGESQSKSIALTFDDGPIPGKTEEILRILKLYNAPAAFFCIGNRVTENPDLTRRIYDAGHLIANHSYWHKATFDLQSTNKISKELLDTDQTIFKAIGVKPRLFRPPYGVTNPMVASAVKNGGYKTIGWSIRSFDTVIKDSAGLLNRITKPLKGGDVILLHDYSNTTLEILPALLEHISKVGLKIVRVDELLNEKAYV
jgi:peptidoglycan/xylan/chitin deacetylase (PgdA/CDA1 family)